MAALVALRNQGGWDWRTIFYVGGIAPIILAVLMAVLLPGPRRRATMIDGPPPRVESVAASLFDGGRRTTTLLLWTSFFFTQLVLLLMLNWLPTPIIGLGYARSGNLGGSVLQFGRQFRCRILAPAAMYHRREEGLRDSLDLAP